MICKLPSLEEQGTFGSMAPFERMTEQSEEHLYLLSCHDVALQALRVAFRRNGWLCGLLATFILCGCVLSASKRLLSSRRIICFAQRNEKALVKH